MALPTNLLICRTCVLKSPSLANIFGDKGALGFSVADLINELLELDVSPGDGLPDRICCNCLNELARFKRFKNICHEAKVTLEYIVKKENTDVLPQIIKEANSVGRKAIENSAVEIVEIDDSSEDDDDSGAETVCAPSPPPVCISSNGDSSNGSCKEMPEENEVTILCEPSTSSAATPAIPSTSEESSTTFCTSTSTAVFLPFEKSLEEKIPYEVEGAFNAEDPLDIELMSSSESGDDNAKCSETDVDVMDVEENDSSFDLKIKTQDHCSRTSGWSRKSTNSVNFPVHSFKESMIKNITEENSGRTRKSTTVVRVRSDRNTEKPISHTVKRRKCPQCSEEFESDLQLTSHVRKKDCQPLNCFFCSKLIFRRQLQEHLEVCDEKPLPYTCVICKKSFKRVESLMSHQSSHSKDKNSVCFTCGQFFPKKKMLKVHRKNCKSLEAVRSRFLFPILRCGECVGAFTRTSSLSKHLRSQKHTNCICGECGDSFPNLHSLCSHIQVSHDHWCYKCPYCPRKFVESHRFSEHTTRCPVANSNKCKQCKKYFTSKKLSGGAREEITLIVLVMNTLILCVF